MKIDGKQFEVNHPDKLFYPGAKLSKTDVMDYYKKIAPHILPHLKNRPLTMVRYPDGIDGKKFYQKDEPDYFPDWIQTKMVDKKEGGKTNYVICNDRATLVYLASQACLEPHCWLSRKTALDKPDKLIFDLDPSDDDFSKVKLAARVINTFFSEKLDTETYVMTTGSRGLHVLVPLKPEYGFDVVRDFAQKVAEKLEAENPEKLTTAARKNKRGDKLFLDVARNAFAQTAVAPYSLRALGNAPVATPIDWTEVSGLTSARDYTMKTIFKRLGQKTDPWKGFYQSGISLKTLIDTFQQ